MQVNPTSNLKHLFRALKLVWQSSPKWSIANAFIILLRGALPILLIYLIKLLIDTVGGAIGGDSQDVFGGDILWVLLLAGGIFLLNSVSNSIATLIRERQSFKINDVIQDVIHARTTTIGYKYFEDSHYQNVFYRAIQESYYRPSKIFFSIVGLFQNGLTLLLIIGLLTTLHGFVLLLMILVSVPIIIVRLKYSKKNYELRRTQTEEERKVGYYNRLLTTRDFAKELRLFNLSSIFKSRYEESKDHLRGKRYDMLVAKTRLEIGVQFITAFAMVSIYGFIAITAVKGNITQGAMVMYFLALQRGYAYLQELLSRISGLIDDSLFLKNLFEFLDIADPVEEEDKLEFPELLKSGIQLKDLSFKYPQSDRWVFKNLNLNIKVGDTVALVGANGAGKTSLIKLICGLYEPSSGIVEIDGQPVSSYSQASLAGGLSVIFQDFMLYNTSARENIWFGDIQKNADDSRIYESASKSGVDKLFEGLPNGYDTKLGTLFEGSEMLSVGEWQRVALSRSFFNDSQLIILDEPTSSLDAFTEAKLINNFKDISKGRTSIIVSHRLATIHIADRIVVLKDHHISEQGSYEELIEKKGDFYQMVNSLKTS